MTMKDFKVLTGLFVVMLSFGLLYSFNIVEPDYSENIHSDENTAFSENEDSESIEHKANGTVSASSINKPEDTEQDIQEEKRIGNGFISRGTLTERLNYDVSSKN